MSEQSKFTANESRAEQNILLVDDKPENLLALESLLKADLPKTVKFYQARSGVKALELLLHHDFSLALLDVQMPEMDGFELAELMRGTERTRTVPIIFVTAAGENREISFRGYESGAVDFLYKPLNPKIVKSKIQVFLELSRQRQLLRKQLHETQDALKQRDEALKSAYEALHARDEFMSVASHELRTPLTSMHLQIQMMARELKRLASLDGETEKKYLKLDKGFQLCERQSSKLGGLLDELLDLTRIRLGKLNLNRESMDLVDVTKDALERLRVKAELQIEEQHVIGNWDTIRIEQVVTNLISNAYKYGSGNPITIRVSKMKSSESARFTIEDQGIGIATDMVDKIFNRYERAISGGQISGLGLGLYIARQIIERHGGRIWVKSTVGQGSTFTFEIPLQYDEKDEPQYVSNH